MSGKFHHRKNRRDKEPPAHWCERSVLVLAFPMVADQCWHPEPHQQRFLEKVSSRPALGLLHYPERPPQSGRSPVQENAGQCPRAMPWTRRPPIQAALPASPTLSRSPRASALSDIPPRIIVPIAASHRSFSGPETGIQGCVAILTRPTHRHGKLQLKTAR